MFSKLLIAAGLEVYRALIQREKLVEGILCGLGRVGQGIGFENQAS